MLKGVLHPGDSKFYWIDKLSGKQMSALWVNTSDDSRLDNFSYLDAEHIQDDTFASKLLNSVNGFAICEAYDSLEKIPTRDDVLTKDHGNKKHALFAGCSMTYGSGLNVGERWVDHVYNEINKDNEYSGLFNLAQAGDSIQNQIGYIFKYCAEYGIPDVIFFHPTDFWRIKLDGYGYKIYAGDHSEYSQDSVANMVINIGKHYYEILDNFCKANNISLVSISWDRVTNNHLSGIDSFVYINNDSFQELCFTYASGKDFEITARDGLHPGTLAHKAWAQIVLNRFNQLLDMQ
jgi:hypothetical protein